MKKHAPENKAATPPTLDETNEAADKLQAESDKAGESGKPLTQQELAKSGYRFPAGFLEQKDPNADQGSVEHKSGDGGASLSTKNSK